MNPDQGVWLLAAILMLLVVLAVVLVAQVVLALAGAL